MNRTLFLALVSDVVWQGIVSSAFWLSIFLTVMILFRDELRFLFNSLGSFKLAGASIVFRDKKTALECYTILINILIEILSRRDSAEKLVPFFSDSNAKQLTKFITKYTKEVSQEDKDVELLKNVAFVAGRKGYVLDAVSLYDSLLKQTPQDSDLLNLKAFTLLNSEVKKHLVLAETILDDLVQQHAEDGLFWYNRSVNAAKLDKFDKSIDSLREAIKCGYWKRRPDMLDAPRFHSMRKSKPAEFEALKTMLDGARENL